MVSLSREFSAVRCVIISIQDTRCEAGWSTLWTTLKRAYRRLISLSLINWSSSRDQSGGHSAPCISPGMDLDQAVCQPAVFPLQPNSIRCISQMPSGRKQSHFSSCYISSSPRFRESEQPSSPVSSQFFFQVKYLKMLSSKWHFTVFTFNFSCTVFLKYLIETFLWTAGCALQRWWQWMMQVLGWQQQMAASEIEKHVSALRSVGLISCQMGNSGPFLICTFPIYSRNTASILMLQHRRRKHQAARWCSD